MVKVEKSDTNFLTGKFAVENDVDEIEILDEFADQDSEFDGNTVTRLTGTVKVNGAEAGDKSWSMSKTNKNLLMDLFGDDTKDWIGKRLAINAPKVNTPKGMQPSVQVDDRRTKKLN